MSFLKNSTLYLTPLSPIHMGSGEEYEPTNYVIDDGFLYHFDPSQAVLNSIQLGRLKAAVNSGKLSAIHRFFVENKNAFKACASYLCKVSDGLAKEYQQKVSRPVNLNDNVFNRFYIERHAKNPNTFEPYVPGSAVKGAMRTVLLTQQYYREPFRIESEHSRKRTEFEKMILKGDYASSPLRLFKMADFTPTTDISSKVYYAVNKKRKASTREARGLSSRRECIELGQYRAFKAVLSQHQLTQNQLQHSKIAEDRLIEDLTRFAPIVSEYFLISFIRDVLNFASSLPRAGKLWKKVDFSYFTGEVASAQDLLNQQWALGVAALLENLLTLIDQGQVMLVRLGKNTGAENKTIHKKAKIKSRTGRGQQPKTVDVPTTCWLAAESDGGQEKTLLPFGWALIEINPQEDNIALKRWCESYASLLQQVRQQKEALTTSNQEELARQQERVLKEQQTRALQQQEEEQKALEAEQKEQEKQAYLKSLSPLERAFEVCMMLLENVDSEGNPSVLRANEVERLSEMYGALTQQLQSIVDNPEFSMANCGRERREGAERLSPNKVKALQGALLVGKRDKEYRALLRQLRGES